MTDWIVLAVLSVVCYLVGNINSALIISKRKNKDIRSMGSGNPGTLNMSRTFGLGLGLLTFFIDVLKGALPTLAAFFVFRGRYCVLGGAQTQFEMCDLAKYLCGFCVVMGHIYPVFLKFKGGKGIASTIGVFIVSESTSGWAWATIVIMALVAAVVFIFVTEFGAMGSFIAITPPAVGGSIRLYLLYADVPDIVMLYLAATMVIFAICFFTWFAHRKNIERMLAGEEHPTSIKEMVVKLRAKRQSGEKNK